MITRVLSLNVDSFFGLVENPLWQVADIAKKSEEEDWNPTLIPLEMPLQGTANSSLVYQTFLSLENLKNPLLLKKLEQQEQVQVWIDRSISPVESQVLQVLLQRFKTIELVYLPDLHFYPDQIFKNLSGDCRLWIHLKTKSSSFDRWLTPLQIWERIVWLRESKKFSFVGGQIFDNQLSENGSAEEKLFLLNPTYLNLMFYLQGHKKIQHATQVSLKSVFRLFGPHGSLFFRQFFLTVLKPSWSNWNALCRIPRYRVRNLIYLKNLSFFYPLRKCYWVIEHAIKKRILRNVNESHQRGDSSFKA